MSIGDLTSRAILASALAKWAEYIDPDTLEIRRIKVTIHHDVERWDGSVVTRHTEAGYASFPDHPLRRGATFVVDGQDYVITEVVQDDGYMIKSAIKKARGVSPC